MKFGVCARVAAQRGRDEGEAHRLILEEAVLAEEEGFDSVWFEAGDQLSGASPFPLAAAVARRTRGIRLVVRPPLGLTHPLYAAEDAAALDILSAGRAVVVPPERPTEEALAAYGVDAASATERTWESAEVLQRAWAPGPFRHEGWTWTIPAELPEHGTQQSRLSVTPKPVQPVLPLWMAPTTTDGASRAAACGLPVVAEASLTRDEVAALLAAHHREASAAAQLIRVAIREVHVAESDDQALSLDPETALAGSVETVVAALESYADAGVNYVACRMTLPGLDADAVRDSMLLFSRAVAPRMRMPGFPGEIRVETLADTSEPMIGYLRDGGWD